MAKEREIEVMIPVVVLVDVTSPEDDPRGSAMMTQAFRLALSRLLPETKTNTAWIAGVGNPLGPEAARKTVLRFREHHEDVFVEASTVEQRRNACLSFLRAKFVGENAELAFFLNVNENTRPLPPNLGLAEDEVRKLPADSMVRKLAEEALEEYAKLQKLFDEWKVLADRVSLCLATDDARLAERLVLGITGERIHGITINKMTVYDKYPGDSGPGLFKIDVAEPAPTEQAT